MPNKKTKKEYQEPKEEFEEFEEKNVDIKGVLEDFVEGEKPEISQEEEIKNYREQDGVYSSKKAKRKKTSEDDEEVEDDEHLKRVKKELLESLERVDMLAKKLFNDKEKVNLKDIKVNSKSEIQKSKNRDEVMKQMREKIQENKERSREE